MTLTLQKSQLKVFQGHSSLDYESGMVAPTLSTSLLDKSLGLHLPTEMKSTDFGSEF